MNVRTRVQTYEDIVRIDLNRRNELLLYSRDDEGDWIHRALVDIEDVLDITSP